MIENYRMKFRQRDESGGNFLATWMENLLLQIEVLKT
jgi:hypothetical protein